MRRRDFLGALGAGVGAALAPRPISASSLGTYRLTALPPYRHFIERWSWAMGQPVHLQLFAESETHGYDAAAAALAELRRVEARLSLFDDASDLAELNRRAGRVPLRGDVDLASVLEASLRLERATEGAFNPAVEPLMRAWGFHARRSSEPSTAEIDQARAAVQAARIVVEGDVISLPSRETCLDLGGIGVGYGLDCAMQVLRRAGIRSAFLDVSGDCMALGSPPGEERGWLVGIAAPTGGGRVITSTRLRDAALATSANTMSVVRYGRAVRGHVMNPETGWPADALTQVTVVSRTGIEADALSTAMLVSGKPAAGVVRYFKA
ncbi:MAG TPA: FAD:protein FMN transferase [Gemmatimonadales bacterium]|nr:FAD:protein FMN transferase [Gemmatimonadales bacterium]